MNFEELIKSKAASSGQGTPLPFGQMMRLQAQGKWLQVVRLREDLSPQLPFQKALQADQQAALSLPGRSQIRFCGIADMSELEQKDSHDAAPESDANWLVLEQGCFLSLEQLLKENPAIVASPSFIDNLTESLFNLLEQLHEKHIYQLCLSPSNVFVRKGELQPMLLMHGSFYKGKVAADQLYRDQTDEVAPEVLSEGHIDSRSDVYALGKLLDYLFTFSSQPIAYKKLIKKATSTVPEDRYNTIGDMRRALVWKKNCSKMMMALVAAVVISCGIFIGIDSMTPETQDMEYVKPAPEDADEDLLDSGFDPESELGSRRDSALNFTVKDAQQIAAYEAKAESIFRKRFAIQAEKILIQAYNKKSMNGDEKQFMNIAQNMTAELLKVQQELTELSGLSDAKTQKIAAEIVDELTENMKNK